MKESLAFLSDIVAALLGDENKKESLPHFERCTIGMVHYYDPNRRNGDFDNCNLEQKRVQGLMRDYMLVVDSCKYVDWYCTGIPAESDWRTEYHFMLPDTFDSWRKSLKNMENRTVQNVLENIKNSTSKINE